MSNKKLNEYRVPRKSFVSAEELYRIYSSSTTEMKKSIETDSSPEFSEGPPVRQSTAESPSTAVGLGSVHQRILSSTPRAYLTYSQEETALETNSQPQFYKYA